MCVNFRLFDWRADAGRGIRWRCGGREVLGVGMESSRRTGPWRRDQSSFTDGAGRFVEWKWLLLFEKERVEVIEMSFREC